VVSRSVYQMMDVERNAGPLLAKADLAVEVHFFHQRNIRSEGPADVVAGLPFVAAEFEAARPLSFEAARWVSSEVVADVAASVSGPSRCLCFAGVPRMD
jgi:hypothetical protein